jgi:hypothetical protein
MLQKNIEGQKWVVYAWNITTDALVTGDAGNITAKIRKDAGSLVATDDVNPTELESGYYEFDLTQEESQADVLELIAVSGTANVQVRGVPESRTTDELLAVKIAGLAVSAQRSALESPGARPGLRPSGRSY